MPAPISVDNQTALAQRAVIIRDFLWLVARNRDTGLPENVGFWSGLSSVLAQVLNPESGLAVARNWYGAGALISVSPVSAVVGNTVQTLTVRMSQLSDLVEQAVRLYDVKLARVELFRGLFAVDSRQQVAPAYCRFVGQVDEVEIRTPAEGEDGYAELRCVGHTQEMLRYNPDTRSHESQIRRSPTDDFFKDAGTVGEWEIFWGEQRGAIA